MLRRIYDRAKYWSPFVVLFDEVDTPISIHSDAQSEGAGGIKISLFIILSKLKVTGVAVMTVADTSPPYAIDSAFLR